MVSYVAHNMCHKAVHLRNVPVEDAVYLPRPRPASNARVQLTSSLRPQSQDRALSRPQGRSRVLAQVWTKTQRLNHIRKEFEDTVLAAPRQGVSEKILAEALKPVPWRLDMWAYGGYAEAAIMMMIQADRDAADKEAEEEFTQFRAAHPSSGPVGGRREGGVGGRVAGG
ncbi:hypothetical protein ONZ51_g12053 [Trametes cubensis]|uniref:Uncharacterized protein n=1 Tax=Trametes cubensis TaxID=1111947 RepID=A0AAD7TGE4_9APHY|nr:hypothetical protein ONZ51_g12053 [Trametes cubensis]